MTNPTPNTQHPIPNTQRLTPLFFFLLLFLSVGRAQAQENYRLRVENVSLGRIEVSVDGGASYRLMGRVAQGAKRTTPDSTATTVGEVARSGSGGMAFSVGAQRILRLLPAQAPPAPPPRRRRGKRAITPPPPIVDPANIITNLPISGGFWRDLLPPVKAQARLETSNGALIRWQENYTPTEEDVFVFTAQLSEAQNAVVKEKAKAIADAYASEAPARARANNRPVVSGNWTLRAQLPEGEPDPIAFVTYLLEGEPLAMQNTPPFSYVWNTRESANGERLIEVRALNRNAQVITKVRVLVAVDNPPK